MKTKVLAVLMLMAGISSAAENTFYVYEDKGSMKNHFIPSGWMGDYGDMKYNDSDTTNPKEGRTAIKITYSAAATQGANWAGIYWQSRSNNWGDKGNGYDLSGYKRLTLWARGDKGGEQLAKFCVGGITGESSDTGQAEIGPIILSKEWVKYTIDLKGQDLKNIIGGLCWSASKDENPKGFTIYLDEVRYEK